MKERGRNNPTVTHHILVLVTFDLKKLADNM